MTIKRIWHGWTTPENADAYELLLRREVFPGIEAKEIPGYLGARGETFVELSAGICGPWPGGADEGDAGASSRRCNEARDRKPLRRKRLGGVGPSDALLSLHDVTASQSLETPRHPRPTALQLSPRGFHHGLLGIELLRREAGDEVEFVTVMTFDTLRSVALFQGEDYERAYVPESARRVLKRWDERSRHFEVRESIGYG